MTRFMATGDAMTAFTVNGVGPPLLLIHGAEASRQMFDAITPHLTGHFTVIAYDQRDCGETTSPPAAATLSQLALDARSLLAALDIGRAHVFGSSFGGRVAQTLAARHPDCVDRLVLGSTWALSSSLASLNPEGSRRLQDLRRELPDSAHELARMFFPESFLVQQPALRDIFARVQLGSDRAERRNAAVAGMLDLPLTAIYAPTLLIAGDSDQVVPARLTLDLANLIAHSEVALLSGVGHATCLQAPAEVALTIIRFIEGHPETPRQGVTQP